MKYWETKGTGTYILYMLRQEFVKPREDGEDRKFWVMFTEIDGNGVFVINQDPEPTNAVVPIEAFIELSEDVRHRYGL